MSAGERMVADFGTIQPTTLTETRMIPHPNYELVRCAACGHQGFVHEDVTLSADSMGSTLVCHECAEVDV